jgi:hypothetical protein
MGDVGNVNQGGRVAYALQNGRGGACSTAITERDINSVFKVDARWDSESVGRLNIMMSRLCAMPKGRELVRTLLELALNNDFQIEFVPERGNRSTMKVCIDWNLVDRAVNSTFARLTFDGTDYRLEEMKVPPFIMMAHELSHMVHFIRTYASLQKINCPPMQPNENNTDPTSVQNWKDFAKQVCENITCSEIFDENKTTCKYYQGVVYRAFAIEKCRMGLGKFQEEEILNIIGDKSFSEGVFLTEAQKCGLFSVGSDGDSPITRIGHANFRQIVSSKPTQAEINALGQLLSRFLPS